ncbi:MAG: rhomboid family intramembrane serine protease [Cytophagaceae bacterium]|nr:rhomboid family intramembrane serine protease [Cytophagaceae bacterium]
MSIASEIKDSFKHGSALTRLIYVNIGLFLAIHLIRLVLFIGRYPDSIFQSIVDFLCVPSAPGALLLKPWTLITYMFTHVDFIHLLFNILYIYWFGRIFMELIGQRLLLWAYLLGGLSGALFYVVFFNLISASGTMLGASASAMAILFAVAMYRPNYQLNLMFIGAVRIKYVALVLLLIDLISISNMQNTGGHVAHIGGAICGLVFARMLLAGTITSPPERKRERKPLFLFGKKGRMKVTHKRPLTDMEYNAIKTRRKREVDRILDKVKQSGYDSLSKDEKKTLFDASKDEGLY